jgi:pimeloyl-ACP methyl ester carboxylesterase
MAGLAGANVRRHERAGVHDHVGPSEFGPVTGRLRDWDVTGRLSEISVPTLVTCGRHDEATPGHVAVLAPGISGSDLAIFEDSSHTAFIEEPELYLDRIEDFLGRVEAARD